MANYGFIATTGNLPGNALQVASSAGVRPTSDASYREAEVIVDTTQVASGKLPITVLLKQGATGEKVVVANYDAYKQGVSYYGGVQNIPATIKFGFTGSTGGQTNYHEIQGMNVTSLATAPGFTVVAPEGSTMELTIDGLVLLGVVGWRRRGVSSGTPANTPQVF